jgi:hypothetical protein
MPPYKPKFFKNVQNGLFQNRAGGLVSRLFKGSENSMLFFMEKVVSMYAVVFEWFMNFLKIFFYEN